jgi:hypothetical protein
MKKKMKSMIAMLVVMAMAVMMTGCDSKQVAIVAKTTGIASAVGWIALDNPTTLQKVEVSKTLDLVKSCITNIQSGQSYVIVYSPIIQKYVLDNPNIPAKDKPLILSGSVTALTGLDVLFANYPTWAEDRDKAQAIAVAFIDGAKFGLGMPDTDPVVMAAKNGHLQRVKMARPVGN